MEMDQQRWNWTSNYLREVFGDQDEHLAGLMPRAINAGLPDIAVSAEVGRLLRILTALTPGRLALEIGTLAGYSAIWIARGLHGDGRLLTIEREPAHAEFARQEFATAGVADRIDIRLGAALDVLDQLSNELPAQSVDVVFADADKTEYPEYWQKTRPLIAPGGLFIADNVLGSGDWWIDEEGVPARDAADRLNRLAACDSEFEATCVPLRQGLLIARRIGE